MTRRPLALALVLSLALPVPAWADAKPAPTEAQKTEARARYERGLKLYEQGSFDAALVEMRRAYELAPTFKILYNLGQIHKQLNDNAAALEAFRQYLAEGGKKIDQKRHGEVEKIIKELEPLVATATVTVDVDGAEITVDDAVVGTSPLAGPILLNAGKRRISAKTAGKAPASRVLNVAGGDSVTVKLEIENPKANTPVAAAEPKKSEAPKAPEAKRDFPLVPWAVTGGLVVLSAGAGVVALISAGNLQDKRDTPNVKKADLDSAASSTKTWALVTDVLLIGTVVSAGVSTWLTFKAPATKDTTVSVHVSPTGLALSGAF